VASQLRQGDVLLVRVASIPDGARRVKRRRGRLVLAAGEAAGHAHEIVAADAELLEAGRGERFLRVLAEGGVALTHEDHAAVLVPPGDYQVVRQREYVPGSSRRVLD
jgi:hypothetical protein